MFLKVSFFFHEKKRYSKHRLTENSMAIYQCRYLNLLKLITFCKSVFLPSVTKTVPATNTALISTLGHQITYFQQGCIDTHFGLPKISSTWPINVCYVMLWYKVLLVLQSKREYHYRLCIGWVLASVAVSVIKV